MEGMGLTILIIYQMILGWQTLRKDLQTIYYQKKSLKIHAKDFESGYLIRDEEPYKPGANIFFIGDSGSNNPSRNFLSFDISGFSGISVTSVEFRANPYTTWGDASGLFPIGIFVADRGAVLIYTCDFDQSGILAGNYSSQNIVFSSESLRNELTGKISSGSSRFQIMIYFTGAETNSNNGWDGYSYGVPSANLTISYTD